MSKQMDDPNQRDPLDVVAEEVLERVRLGESPSLTEYTARYPDHADELRDLFPTLLMMERFGSPDISGGLANAEVTSAGLRKLGDYVILREVGRGGMGIVYEAEQESLGRRVALKVLSARSRLDPNQIKRFDREARSVARLEHPSIVPVYAIGDDKGVPFYVMKFVAGQGLDEVLNELRVHRSIGLEFVDSIRPGNSHAVSEITCAMLSGTAQVDPSKTGQFSAKVKGSSRTRSSDARSDHQRLPIGSNSSVTTGSSVTPVSGVFPTSSDGETRSDGAQLFRTVAKIGIHVARALDYAHEQQVLHRDIKPSNLLLDTHGQIWVTDFGLAKIRTEDDITNTGDFVGTLRYTSPEQLRGWSDPRSDIYSLGITLYELLTLRPAFPERDRTQLMMRIAHESPAPMRRVDRLIPDDLATIVQKAISKEPQQRYATAKEFADDLERFIDNKPIQARPIPFRTHLQLWVRRNPVIAALSASLVTFMAVALVVVSYLWQQAEMATTERMEEVYHASLTESRAIRKTGRPELQEEALAAVARAAEIRTSVELRNEAIALFASPGMRAKKRISRTGVTFTEQLDKYAYVDNYFTIVVASVDDDQVLARHTPNVDPENYHDLYIFGFAPNGHHLAYQLVPNRGTHNTVIVWNSKSDEIVVTAEQTQGMVFFAPDSSFVAMNKNYGDKVFFYSLNGEPAPVTIKHPKPSRRLALHPHKPLIAVGDLESTQVIVYDLTSGGALKEFSLPHQAHGIGWSPDGKSLAVGCFDTRAYIWDYATEQQTHILSGHAETVAGFGFHPNGHFVSTLGWDSRVVLWDLRSEEQVARHVGTGGKFSPDGRNFITLENYRDVTIWELPESECVREIDTSPAPISEGSLAISASRDDKLVGATFSDGVRLWNLESGEMAAHIPCGDARAVIFHPDAMRIITCGAQGLQAWYLAEALAGKSPQHELLSPPLHGISKATMDGAGATFAIVDELRSVRVVNVENDSPPMQISHLQHPRLANAAISCDAKWVATGTWQGRGVKVFDATDGSLLRELVPEERNANPTFSPDGQFLVTNCSGKVMMWDTSSWTLSWDPFTHSQGGSPGRAFFSPDGTTLAFRSSGTKVRLLNTADGTELATFEHPDQQDISSLCFTHDGNRLICLDKTSQTIRVWDLHRLNEQLQEYKLNWR